MNCPILFSRKNRNNFISLSSVQLAQSVFMIEQNEHAGANITKEPASKLPGRT